jgi:hypothetical protein
MDVGRLDNFGPVHFCAHSVAQPAYPVFSMAFAYSMDAFGCLALFFPFSCYYCVSCMFARAFLVFVVFGFGLIPWVGLRSG